MSSEQLSFFMDTRISEKSHEKEKIKMVISASRRTDIPAFYYEWLQDALKKQKVEVANPMYRSKTYTIDLKPDNVHSIVLWSKDFSKVARDPELLSNYNLYFQYTINNYSKMLEPNVPDFDATIKTVEILLKTYRPAQFNIRFDPIIISSKGEKLPTPEAPPKARLAVFEQLCKEIKCLGLNGCRLTTSYISFYGHVQNRMCRSGIDIVYFNEKEIIHFFEELVQIADKYGLKLYSCANPILEKVNGINIGHCIDGRLLVSLFGGKVSLQKDRGQRINCQCTLSRDIGSYADGTNTMECHHGCRYCYIR